MKKIFNWIIEKIIGFVETVVLHLVILLVLFFGAWFYASESCRQDDYMYIAHKLGPFSIGYYCEGKKPLLPAEHEL